MMKHVIRMGPAWLRCPLLLIVWPASFARGLCTMPDESLGRFCWMSLDVFAAAWRGEFVPK